MALVSFPMEKLAQSWQLGGTWVEHTVGVF